MLSPPQFDHYGVIARLIYNRADPFAAEGVARLLGLVHLYRASGVHILAFATLLDAVCIWIFRESGLEVKRAKFISFLAVISALFWIWHLQDLRLTMIRPLLTFLIRRFFRVRGARARILLPLLLTFATESCISQDSALTDGALHYYLAVGGGLLGYELCRESDFWKRHLSLALGSWFPLAWVSLLHDHVISYFTPIWSLLTLPVITLFLYPFTLLDVFFHHEVSPFTVAMWNQFLDFIFAMAEKGVLFSSVHTFALYFAIPLGLLFAWRWSRMQYRYVATAVFTLILNSLAPEIRSLEPHVRTVAQLDVGQGDSALLQDAHDRTELIDVGSLRAMKPDEWINKLSRNEVLKVDAVLFSHLDEDHVGAIKALVNWVNIECVETNQEWWASEKGLKLASILHAESPETRLASGGCMRLPKIAWFRSHRNSGNELMAGSVFELGKGTAYFALGDGDDEQELDYYSHFRTEINRFPIRIWKVGHHGSRFSSDPTFLDEMNASEYWISVGAHNPYHHPHPSTLLKLAGRDAKIYRTDVVGDVRRSVSE